MPEGWLIALFGQKVVCFFNAKMAFQEVIVVPANELCLNSLMHKK